RILIAFLWGYAGGEAATDFTDVEYNGVAATGEFTPDITQSVFSGSNWFRLKAFYWLESDLPSGGAYNITATSAGSQWDASIVAESFTGALQSEPADKGGNTSTASPTTSTTAVTTSEANEMIVDCVAVWAAIHPTMAATAGQTEPSPNEASMGTGFIQACAYESVTTATTYNQTWSFSTTANNYIAAAIGIEPAADAWSGPQVDTTSSGTGTGTTTTVSHTFAANDDKKLIVTAGAEWNGALNVTGITYNGVALTQIIEND
ncbi:unnamed protein product, partial [marine sediment metagenome]